MILQDIFDQLSHGELSQLHLGGDDEYSGVREQEKPRIIAHIQLGLTALHKRFLLKQQKVVIELEPGRSTYILNSKFAQSNTKSKELVKYLNDLNEPLKDNLLQIERVVNDKGEELTLNVTGDPDTVRTMSYNTLIVPDGIESETLTVVYRANHPTINPILGKVVSFQVEIDLPATHLEALLYFVASRVMNPIGLANEFHEGNNYAAKYEQACMELEMNGYELNSVGTSTRFEDNGWV